MKGLIGYFNKAIDGLGLRDQCPACGAPDPDGVMFLLLRPDEEPPTCAECEGPTDRVGRALGQVHDGVAVACKLFLIDDPPELEAVGETPRMDTPTSSTS